jgi:hypothetical protein
MLNGRGVNTAPVFYFRTIESARQCPPVIEGTMKKFFGIYYAGSLKFSYNNYE